MSSCLDGDGDGDEDGWGWGWGWGCGDGNGGCGLGNRWEMQIDVAQFSHLASLFLIPYHPNTSIIIAIISTVISISTPIALVIGSITASVDVDRQAGTAPVGCSAVVAAHRSAPLALDNDVLPLTNSAVEAESVVVHDGPNPTSPCGGCGECMCWGGVGEHRERGGSSRAGTRSLMRYLQKKTLPMGACVANSTHCFQSCLRNGFVCISLFNVPILSPRLMAAQKGRRGKGRKGTNTLLLIPTLVLQQVGVTGPRPRLFHMIAETSPASISSATPLTHTHEYDQSTEHSPISHYARVFLLDIGSHLYIHSCMFTR